MKVYVVNYSDYDTYHIMGVFADKSKAEKCKEYELKKICKRTYGEQVEIVECDYSDDVDFDAKIAELEEDERQERKAKEDAIKEADLAEFNRIKEKYNL